MTGATVCPRHARFDCVGCQHGAWAPQPTLRQTMARRATFHEARRHFTTGGRVLVTESGHAPFVTVTADTTTHSPESTTWAELAELVRMWRSRYPAQRFYIVEEPSR